MRRFIRPLRTVPVFAAVLMVATVLAIGVGTVGAQTTTTGPTTTTRPTTTTGASSTTRATTPGTGTATTAPGTATTLAPLTAESDSDSGSDIPWVPIAIGAGILLAIVIALIVWSRARGAASQKAADWRSGAADATAEAGATARMLSGGSPATAAVAQQMLASLRAFEDLEESAPDNAARSIGPAGTARDSEPRPRNRRRLQPAACATPGEPRSGRRVGGHAAQHCGRNRPGVAGALPRLHRDLVANLVLPVANARHADWFMKV